MLLSGVRILDLTRLLPGPYATRLLADLGAEVIKVEDTGAGDYLRAAAAPWFACLNAGKQAIRLNLKDARGREALLRLAATADAVLEGFRPGVMERLGLGFADLRAVNGRLVLVSLTGYGQEGPHRDRAGHDLNYLALSGILSLMPGAPPAPPPLQIADLCAGGLTAALGLVAAVLRARAAGEGAHVDAAMLSGLTSLGGLFMADAAAGADPRRETLLLAGRLACYRTYATADGRAVALAALEPRFWAAFCQGAGRADWADRQMEPDQAALAAELADWFATRTMAEWADWAAAHPDACLEPVLTPAEAAAHPATGGPEGSPLRVRTGGGWQRGRPGGGAPAPGAHTRALLAAVGYSAAELDGLAAAGVI